jgi:protease-4
MRTDALTPILESGPLDVEQLMETGLADAIGWPHDAEAAAIQRAGKGSKTLDILSYVPPSPAAKAPAIAIVGGEGPIMTGSADGSLFAEGRGFASDTVAEALYAAGKDPEVEAIVFRVNSPGGSATASDQIWRAVQEVREAFDKPVVVSMADYAASGGYYVSAGADWIVANPSTITGSIGIFGGKFGISGALDEIGINAEAIEVGGSFTGAFTTTEPFTEGQREAITQWLQRGYDRFVSLVADGRGLAVEEVDARARGRVWSGQHALEQGLVDELGGIMTAIAKARSLANIPESSEVRYLTYPQSEAGFSIGPQQMSAGSLGQFGSLVTLLELLNQPGVQQAITGVSNPSRLQLESRTPVYVEH